MAQCYFVATIVLLTYVYDAIVLDFNNNIWIPHKRFITQQVGRVDRIQTDEEEEELGEFSMVSQPIR